MSERRRRREVRVVQSLPGFADYITHDSYDLSDPTRHPTSKAMEKARLETFSKVSWPHDTVKGHGANSKAVSVEHCIYAP